MIRMLYNSLKFAEFTLRYCKKWDAHFRASHFLYFMEEVYFFQITDLQFWKAFDATSTLSSELSITRSRFSQPKNALAPIDFTLDESCKLVKPVQP